MSSRSTCRRLLAALVALPFCAPMALPQQPAPAPTPPTALDAGSPAQAPTTEKPTYTPEQQQQLNRASNLLTQASKLNDQGKYRDAIPLAAESLKLRESVLRPTDHRIANACSWLGLLNDNAGNHADALPLLQRALKIDTEVYGLHHPEVATDLNNLASLYDTGMGDHAQAEPLYQQALAIKKEVLGEKHPDYAASLNNLALLYKRMGNYAKAEPLYRQALAIRKEILGEKHPDYAQSLDNLAGLYDDMGNYAQAEPLYQQALAIKKEVLGEKHPDYAASLNNLAELYRATGDYAKAEPLYQQTCAINKEVLGEKHPWYAATLDNLAQLYQTTGDYAKAEPLYQQALSIRKEVLGEKHPAYATSLNNLAGLYVNMGDYTKAEPLFQQASAICKEVLGEKHPNYAISLNSLAQLYQAMGDYAKAEPLYQQALAIKKEVLGEKHPAYATSLNNLAGLYRATGDYHKAEPLAHQALGILRDKLELTAAVQSERQQLRMAEIVRLYLDNYLSTARGAGMPAEQTYAEVLTWKGAVSARQQAMRQLRNNQSDPKVAELYKKLADTARQLDSLSRAAPKPDEAEQYKQKLAELNDSLETLQQQLAAASADYRRELEQQKRTPADLQRALPPDCALVDLIEYHHYQPPKEKGQKASWVECLTAFIIRPDQSIQWIELGPAKPIADLVDHWRQSYSTTDGAQLRHLIWDPVEEKLAGATTVLISPDGALDRFPLAALPGKQEGTYLIEDVAIATVPIPRLLPEVLAVELSPMGALGKASHGVDPSLLTVGDVDFKAALEPLVQNDQLALRAPSNRDGGGWQFNPLDGTRAEITAIDDTFAQRFPAGRHESLRHDKATKQAVCEAMPRYSYLHLATHGFFAPPEIKSILSDGNNEKQSAPKSDTRSGALDVAGYHPDLLSGLALAGANQKAESGQDDGILTALEVASLNLQNVNLVVLSACETGLGQTAGGEGVLGLQRAFQLAGAHTTVTSFWSVDDDATQTLMTEFYSQLWNKDHSLGKLAALRHAQLDMLRHYDQKSKKLIDRGRGLQLDADAASSAGPLSPKYWAAFELSGDWR